MEGWIGKVESYIAPDFAIGRRIANKLNLEDLYIICGEKSKYSLSDAQALHKRQWNRDRYLSEMDDSEGYTPPKMLEILKLRARYLIERGSTLNNPHIPRSFFSQFSDQIIDVNNSSSEEISATIQRDIRDITLANTALQWTL